MRTANADDDGRADCRLSTTAPTVDDDDYGRADSRRPCQFLTAVPTANDDDGRADGQTPTATDDGRADCRLPSTTAVPTADFSHRKAMAIGTPSPTSRNWPMPMLRQKLTLIWTKEMN